MKHPIMFHGLLMCPVCRGVCNGRRVKEPFFRIPSRPNLMVVAVQYRLNVTISLAFPRLTLQVYSFH